MAPACSQALGLPEIVATILEQLPDRKALFAALQVNRLWAHEATMVLWRKNPPIQALVQISDIERRQYYANRISSLMIRERDASESTQLQNTHFPRLVAMHISVFNCLMGQKQNEELGQCFFRYLHPGLRSFKCFVYQTNRDFLMQLATRCPDLRVLLLDWLPYPVPTCDLGRFLNLVPSLTHVELACLVDSELYLPLALLPNLLELRMSRPTSTFTEDSAITVLANVTHPYPKLKEIFWGSQGKAFSCLAIHLSSLNVLDLFLVDTSSDVLFAISSCTNLATIEVWFDQKSHVLAEGLLAVARKCSHLRVFSLSRTAGTEVDGTSISDDIIRQVATYLPAMTSFKLEIQTNLTITAVIHLGTLCAKLKECNLKGSFCLEQLWRPNSVPLFPQLTSLELHLVEDIPYERAMSILRQQAPQFIKAPEFLGSGSETRRRPIL